MMNVQENMQGILTTTGENFVRNLLDCATGVLRGRHRLALGGYFSES